jgi:glucosyl-dolichyl phosphate glucuronosyltransferase
VISVVVLTHRRLLSLKALLDVLKLEHEDFEIVLVNNSPSTDEEALLEEYKNIRYIPMGASVELAQARNLGMSAGEGEYIAFIDDDCIPKTGWLTVIKENLTNFDAIAGPVISYLSLRSPWWWMDEYNWLIGLSQPAMVQDTLGQKYIPQTANLAFKRKLAYKVQFREVSDKHKLSQREDTLFWKDILSKGFSTQIIPEMIVYHRIPQERLEVLYCIKRSFNDGLSQGYFKEEDTRRIVLFGLQSFLEVFIEVLRLRPKVIVTHIFQVSRVMGYIYGLFLRRKKG